MPTLLADGRLPLTSTNQDRPVKIPGLKVPLPTSELPSDLHPGAYIPNAYENFLRTSRGVGEAPIVLLNTFRELEEEPFAALDELHESAPTRMPKAIPIGPLLPLGTFSKEGDASSGSEELDGSIMRFLDSQGRRSVLYVAFGTVGILNGEKQIEEMAMGLEGSGCAFLWTQGPSVVNPNKAPLDELVPPG